MSQRYRVSSFSKEVNRSSIFRLHYETRLRLFSYLHLRLSLGKLHCSSSLSSSMPSNSRAVSNDGSKRILLMSLGKARSIQWISSSPFQPCRLNSGTSSIGSCDEFQILATTFALFECNNNVDWQGGRCDISITFFWLTCLRSNISLLTLLTFFFLLLYRRHTNSSRASANSPCKSHDKPREVKVSINFGFFSTIFQQTVFLV